MEDDTLARSLARDWRTADLTPADRAMLAYVVKLTVTPWAMTPDDAAELETLGFNDTALLDIVQVAGYYAFVNRLADGLGVQLEDYWADEDMVLTREEFLARKAARRGHTGAETGDD